MKVSEIMSNHVVTVSPMTNYKDIWSIFFTHHINAVPVVDSHKKLQGIVSKEDLLKTLYPDYLDLVDDFSKASDFQEMEEKVKDLLGVTARDIMNTHVIFARGDSQVMRVLSRMIAQKVDQLPVLSDGDEVIGMITKGDVFKGLFKTQVRPIKVQKAPKMFVKV